MTRRVFGDGRNECCGDAREESGDKDDAVEVSEGDGDRSEGAAAGVVTTITLPSFGVAGAPSLH